MSSKAISAAARAMAAQRKTFAGGAPVVLGPCRYCHQPMGARARRVHEPHCPKKTARKVTV